MNFSNYAAIHARHLPEKVCLIERTPSIGSRRTLTWKAFNDAINRTANYLSTECGVKHGDYVMHLQNNSLEWLITYFGIIRLGAIVVPLNFRFESRDVVYAAGVCTPRVFIFGNEFLEKVVQPVQDKLKSVEKFICVGGSVPADMIDYKTIESWGDASNAVADVDLHHDLAMMFTSGTTGNPKPVIHTHFSLKNTAVGNGMTYFVRKNDNYMVFLPLFHSGTMFLWAPFYATGATGTLLREFNDPKYIIDTMAEEKCTDTFFVVPVGIMVLNAIEDGTIKLSDYDLSAWRYLEIGAQPVPSDIMRSLVETLPCGVSNIYGITEGGGGGTFNLYPEDVLRKPGSIGKPTFGVEAKIIEYDGSELPPGKVGELIFKTDRMMKAYHNNPEMTESVLKNGWLQTGDLLKTDEEGYYYIVDRAKDMITSGGENIYPVEIEDALMDHPDIDDVACIGYPDDRLVEIVMAVIQLKAGKTMTEEELITYAKTKMATYKIPRKVVFDPVPRSATGKVMKPVIREKYTGRRQAFKSLS